VLGDAATHRIEAYLQKVQDSLQVQFAVVTVPTVEPLTIEEYAVRLFETWGIGGAARDEGLLLLLAVQDRQVRFEVGYGLEGALPDARVGTIIRRTMTPRFQAGDFAGGVLDGLVEAAAHVAEDKHLPAPRPDGRVRRPRTTSRPESPSFLALLVLGIIVFAVVSSMAQRGGRGRRGRDPWRGRWYDGGFGGPWGGGGFGGGGFGGGGMGGGFGGFGGGASGGGGATGHW
jgi:uncharacterized protein